MEKFIKFLKENNAWEKFEKNFNKDGEELKEYKKMCKMWRNSELSLAFTWAATEEKYSYWLNLNRKWCEENKTLEEKLLSDD